MKASILFGFGLGRLGLGFWAERLQPTWLRDSGYGVNLIRVDWGVH